MLTRAAYVSVTVVAMHLRIVILVIVFRNSVPGSNLVYAVS